MKKFSILGCIAAALLSIAGCEQTGNDDSMTNYIYLSSDKTSMFEIDNEPIVVEVMLRNSLAEDVELTFALSDNSGIVRLENNPVLIPAGEKTGYLKIYPGGGDLASTTNYTVSLDATAELTADLTLKAPFTFALVPVEVEPLTEEQNAIIAAYKAATGIDLAKFMGIVSVSTEITGLEFDSEEEFTKTVTGETLITLSEEATAEIPVLKMLSNPMGIQDHMYSLLRKMTVENYEYWFPEDFVPEEGVENPFAMYETLCNTISWNADSKEVFSMSLDNINFNADKSIEFVHEYYQPYYEDNVSVVPFAYEFTAYDREKAAVEAETLEDNSYYLCTANPEYYFNYTGILEDEWEAGYGIYAEPKAEITEDGKLVFTFCFDYSDYAYDYTRVVATYTPNN
jgi:hypothetical protein